MEKQVEALRTLFEARIVRQHFNYLSLHSSSHPISLSSLLRERSMLTSINGSNQDFKGQEKASELATIILLISGVRLASRPCLLSPLLPSFLCVIIFSFSDTLAVSAARLCDRFRDSICRDNIHYFWSWILRRRLGPSTLSIVPQVSRHANHY